MKPGAVGLLAAFVSAAADLEGAGDAMTISDPTDERATAGFGGPAVPGSGRSTIRPARVGASFSTATRTRVGKVTTVVTIQVA